MLVGFGFPLTPLITLFSFYSIVEKMQIAGYKFHPYKGPSVYSAPGIFIYIHQSSGKCFVRAMSNRREQYGKNSFPESLRELLKTNASDVLIYVADVSDNTRETLHAAAKVIRTNLASKGMLYKSLRTKVVGGQLVPVKGAARFTVWEMTHRATGAVYYMEEVKDVCVQNRVSRHMLTFNNYVIKRVVNTNRSMYHFAKNHFPMDVDSWDVVDLSLDLDTEKAIVSQIAMLSKKHLEGKGIVLNRVCNEDALDYSNLVLRLPTRTMAEYLG